MNRYLRQIAVSEIGAAGQARIEQASVLVIGAGGLGNIVLQYLNAAGIGRLVIVDHDQVEESNLHRQPLYRISDLGASKANAAREALLQTNPHTQIESVAAALTPANAAALVSQAQFVVDAADSFAVTYILSDECARVGKPLISASVLGLSGYAAGFCGGAPSYRAVFPEMPQRAGTCAEAGVLGTAVGVIGALQAHLTLSLILGLQPPVLGRLVSVDFKTLRFGGFQFGSATEPDSTTALKFIAASEIGKDDRVFDLRTTAEINNLESIDPSDRIVLCCRSGVRAWRAARSLQQRGYRNLVLLALG